MLENTNQHDPITRKLVLASASPRRRELLQEAGYTFVVFPAENVDETYVPDRESPLEHVQRLARDKADEIVRHLLNGITAKEALAILKADEICVIGCDTVAVCDGEVLGKPHDLADARSMLEKLSGREHEVVSGLCVWPLSKNQPVVRLATTLLRMDRLTQEQLDEYLASGQWSGKSGAFGYQDRTGWIHVIQGSESNVVGLPLELLAKMLREVNTLPGDEAS